MSTVRPNLTGFPAAPAATSDTGELLIPVSAVDRIAALLGIDSRPAMCWAGAAVDGPVGPVILTCVRGVHDDPVHIDGRAYPVTTFRAVDW